MQFCPQCKSIMMPNGNLMKCRKCSFQTEKIKGKKIISKKDFEEREVTVIESSEAAGFPTTRAVCKECGNDTAYWWLRQLRSADESETRFFRCTKCGCTWREYD